MAHDDDKHSHIMEQAAAGIQSIERAIAVVRTVAQSHRDGTRLVDVVRELGISKSTAHRILQALVQAGWLEQSDARGRFHLGLELHALGLAAAPRHELAGFGERAVARIADQVGDTAYFQLRSGFDTICLARCVGSYPVKILTVDVGIRRPLGMGAGSLAVLAFLPDHEIETVLATNLDDLSTFATPGTVLDSDLVWSLVHDARRRGYSYVEDIFIPGMAAIGMPIRGVSGEPVGAFAVAAITNRLGDDRRGLVTEALEREVRTIEARLGKLGAVSPASPSRTRPQPSGIRPQSLS